MKSVFLSSFYEMIRSRWIFVYTLFYLLLLGILLLMSTDVSKIAITLTNVVLTLTPLIAILFGTTYFYQSKDFMTLIFSQPISRWNTLLAIYGGLALALCLSVVVGLVFPLLVFGVFFQANSQLLILIIAIACLLSIIFSLLAFVIALHFDDKVKGLGVALFTWLFFAIIYDGLILVLLFLFRDYPLDKFTIGVVLFNPIDLARILITLQLDISAMMGYTGAVLSKFLGTKTGMLFSLFSLVLWVLLPLIQLRKICLRKDF